LRGSRVRPRRSEERRGAFFVDRFAPITLAMVVTLLALTLVDGLLTIELLAAHSEEANPIMEAFALLFVIAQGIHHCI
jgi:succinate dehydrogenase hydrophobic anchor subunit